jgi:hypothetical protein
MKSKLTTKISKFIGRDVVVHWPDTQTNPNWGSISDLPSVTPPMCECHGVYMGCKRRGKKILWLLVAHNLCKVNGVCDHTVIPYSPEVRVELL